MIEAAFDKSDFLAVEANIDDVNRLDIQKLLKSAVYMDGSTLDKHVSKKTLDIIKEDLNACIKELKAASYNLGGLAKNSL